MQWVLWPGQIPELRQLSFWEREELCEEGVLSLPVNATTVASLSAALAMIGVIGSLGVAVFGRTCLWFITPVGAFGLWVTLLNLARGRVLELLNERHRSQIST